MSLQDRNKQITEDFNKEIKRRKLQDKLEFDPIPNTCKRRPHFYQSNGMCVFTAFMWQLNKLSNAEAHAEIVARVDEAVKHFQL